MADNTKVGGLEIEITASAENAVTALDRLASTLERLDGQSGKSGRSLEALSAKLKNLANTPGFSKLVGDVERIKTAGTGAAAGVEKLSAATEKASRATSMDKLEKELKRIESQADRDGNALLKLQEKLEGMKALEGKGTPGTQLEWANRIRQTEEELQRLSATIDALDVKRRSLQQAISAGTTSQPVAQMSEALKTAAKNCENVSGAAKKADKSLRNAAKGAKEMGDAVEEAGDKGQSGFGKLLDMIGRMTLRMVILRGIRSIFSGIGDGLKEAAQQNQHVNETLSKIASSVEFVRDALVAAILPAIEAIAPILTFLLDALAKIFNFVAKIIGFLTGQKSVVQAKKQFVDFAGSLNETASAAKAALKYLLPIDELNIIDNNGGSGGVTPGGLHFEDSNVDLPEWELKPFAWPGWDPPTVSPPLVETVTIPAPNFESVDLPEWVKQPLPVPEWATNPIPAPDFEVAKVPEWATAPFPSPAWSVDPIPAPAIDPAPVEEGLQAIEGDFSVSWENISVTTETAGERIKNKLGDILTALAKARVTEAVTLAAVVADLTGNLSTGKAKVEDFVKNTTANLAAWRTSVTTSFTATSAYIPVAATVGLAAAGAAFNSFLKNTSENVASWGENVAANVKSTMEYIPTAAASGLSAAAQSFASWANGTASNIVSWGNNLISNGAKTISGFVKNFISGLKSAWDSFVSFMKGIGEKISNWWDGNKSWAAPVAVGGLVALGVTAAVLTGGLSLPALGSLGGAALLPALAGGGVATKPTTALIGEYPGAQSNPEIVAPQSILRQTFRQELNGGVSNEEVINAIYAMGERVVRAINDKDTNIYMDGDKVTKRVTRLQKEYAQMLGL